MVHKIMTELGLKELGKKMGILFPHCSLALLDKIQN